MRKKNYWWYGHNFFILRLTLGWGKKKKGMGLSCGWGMYMRWGQKEWIEVPGTDPGQSLDDDVDWLRFVSYWAPFLSTLGLSS